MKCGVYQIRNTENQKVYIGSSYRIKSRFTEHRRLLNSNTHHNSHLQNAWNKYGEKCFVFEIVEYCSIEHLLKAEQRWLEKTSAKYNILNEAGTTYGFRHSTQTKQKMSIDRRGDKNSFYGKTHTQEVKEQLHKLHSGKSYRGSGWKHTDANKRKMSNLMKGKMTGEKNPFYGKKHDQETIEKMKNKLSQKMRGENNPFFGKQHSEKTKKLLSEKLTGRKMPVSFSEKLAERNRKKYSVSFKGEKPFTIDNLNQFCVENNLNLSSVRASIHYKRPYKDYTFKPN
jgi:predicted GIY-YIG superfamily endonuclease